TRSKRDWSSDVCSSDLICVKGTSARPMDGNLPPRLFPTASGMLNSIGLENVGVDAFIRDKMPFLRNAGCAVFVNVFGFNEDEYRSEERRVGKEWWSRWW